jgi:cytidyltransferase-like protein
MLTSLDTRIKIVAPDGVRRDERPLSLVIGYFDPLHAAHIRRLNELCKGCEQIVVALADPPEPLLPLRARAELVASLGCVDYVVTDADRALTELHPDVTVDERSADLHRFDRLRDHVIARHRGA